jgi:hypothetical protein
LKIKYQKLKIKKKSEILTIFSSLRAIGRAVNVFYEINVVLGGAKKMTRGRFKEEAEPLPSPRSTHPLVDSFRCCVGKVSRSSFLELFARQSFCEHGHVIFNVKRVFYSPMRQSIKILLSFSQSCPSNNQAALTFFPF